MLCDIRTARPITPVHERRRGQGTTRTARSLVADSIAGPASGQSRLPCPPKLSLYGASFVRFPWTAIAETPDVAAARSDGPRVSLQRARCAARARPAMRQIMRSRRSQLMALRGPT